MHLENCRADAAKLTDYLLNDDHRDGGPKSRFFKAFGFTSATWEVLRDALLNHPSRRPVRRIIQSVYGTKFEVVCSVYTPDGRDPCIVTVWQLRGGVGDPVLVTAYPAFERSPNAI